MSKYFSKRVHLSLIASLFWACSLVGSETRTEFSVTQSWISEADLDQGGELGVDQTDLEVGVDWSLGRGSNLGLSIGASFQDYDFGQAGSADFVAPWGDVVNYSIGLGWRRPIGDDGVLFIAPSMEIARGKGADWSKSFTFGTILSYGYRVSETLTIGVGAGVFTGLEETSAFPVLLVDWQINDNWRVGNPFRPGPAGPAGLEMVYSPNTDWEVALGGGWRSNRFRLDEDGTNPDGIGEIEGIPVFLRLTWMASESVSIDLYAGQFISGEITVENRKGKKIGSDDLDSTPVAALSISSRF
ncbi:hypothetical protein G0Q06_04135 [Puniceicoccales bacterium CK1056]|uniref:DUF6268 domain-containing protein n=1 Tax=Oceanipulchritudo coccoides TaxID=2706888 RepID=A0A6B2LZQ9_9BACT|nr:DUF6268 family outer membrane beta-barrel protein [Oceanipulchritudo coccoides]NDV61632.1 hypothetical protein [Oceanipulchritudo coccoides]